MERQSKSAEAEAAARLERLLTDDTRFALLDLPERSAECFDALRSGGWRYYRYIVSRAETERAVLLVVGISLKRALQLAQEYGQQTVVYKTGSGVNAYCAAAGGTVRHVAANPQNVPVAELVKAVFCTDVSAPFALYERQLINPHLGFANIRIRFEDTQERNGNVK